MLSKERRAPHSSEEREGVVESALESTFDTPPTQFDPSESESEALCRHFARSIVGRIGLKEAQGIVRDEMYAEALARSGGSRRGAARVLGINRRCVQRLAAELEEMEPPEPRATATSGTAPALRGGASGR